jgi:hypothetical protein
MSSHRRPDPRERCTAAPITNHNQKNYYPLVLAVSFRHYVPASQSVTEVYLRNERVNERVKEDTMGRTTKRGLAVALCAAVVGLGSTVYADGPEVGVNAGMAFPLSKYRRTIDPDIGGTIGVEGGYRFNLTDNFALSIIGNPQFFIYDSEHYCCGDARGAGANGHYDKDDIASVFSITGGPRFSLLTGAVESYVGIAGGYYRDLSGQMEDDGAGFNAGGGIAFEVAPNTTLGWFGRYDYANMVARPGSDVARQWASTGITVQHVFQPEEAPVYTPPPPPPAPAPRPPPPPPPPVTELRGG